jgi:DNA ligase (NAD+)
MYKIGIIGDRDTVLGFMALGFAVEDVSGAEEAAKKLHQYFYGSMEEFENAIKDEYRFSRIEGISDSVNRAIYEWYEKRGNRNMLHALMAELEFIGVQKQEEGNTNPFLAKNIVVTGTFEHFDRQGLLNLLDSLGATTHNTVSTDTDFLIYGSLPGSKKVAKAIENGVTMVNEQSFVEMLEQNR